MEGLWLDLSTNVFEFLNNPSIMETFVDIIVCAVPIWLAVMIGLMIGWSWRPKWTGLIFLGFRSKFRFVWAPPGIGVRRFWLAFTAISSLPVCRRLWFSFRDRGRKFDSSVTEPASNDSDLAAKETEVVDDASGGGDIGSLIRASDVESSGVTEKDLEHLLHLLEGKNGEMSWQSMMERSTSNMTYQAWRHEPDVGPIVYRSKTIFEDASPELVRDFFWDDELRPKWDPMLVHVKILEECPQTGMMIIHWIKKFPFFCSDREYVVGRRIWEQGKSNYCVTKVVPYPSLPRRDKPRRVDLYFSSWVIKPAQSRKVDGQSPTCEVTLIHYEDMGIPKDVAKLGVRHGMWGTVKKLHAGFRAYQNARKHEASLTRCALMARITTKISCEEGSDNEEQEEVSNEEEKKEGGIVNTEVQKDNGGIDWKWVVIGGGVALVCGLQTGLFGRALLIGAGHRVARRQQRNSRR